MAYLKGFGLENFRVFKEYTWFDFAPITILVGPNSSGKSSLIKALLLLKDNYERDILFRRVNNAVLKFDGGSHNLSSGKNIINLDTKDDQFRFVFDYDLKSFKAKLIYEFIFQVDQDASVKYSYVSIKTQSEELLFRLTNESVYLNIPRILACLVPDQELIDSMVVLDKTEEDDYLNKIFYQHIKGTIRSQLDKTRLIKKFFGTKSWEVNTVLYADYFDKNKPFYQQINVEDENGYYYTDEVSISQEEFINNVISGSYISACVPIFNEAGRAWLTKENAEQAMEAFHSLFELFNLENNGKELDLSANFSQLGSLLYLPSIKGQSKRSYQSNEDHVINSLIKSFKESSNNGMSEYLMRWQKTFGIGEITIKRDDRLDANYITVNDRSLTDLGFGLSQLTALLVMIGLHDNHNKNILLLEEPEANLHPKYQSLLADLLSEASRQNQFIIETHSEYLIRKLQYLTAKGEIKPEDTVIYYFNDPNNVPAGEKQVKKINILEDGSLSDDFGPGFYDEAAHWKFELLRLKNTRKN
ncbi:hypothetical protein GCM10027341_10130 [Spirosoma knui]